MCPSEKALEVRAFGERSESFALGKRFAVANLLLAYRLEPSFDRDCSSRLGPFSVTRDPSQHRQRSLDSSRPGRLGNKLIVAYLTPFLIISKIGCPFPFSLRKGKHPSLLIAFSRVSLCFLYHLLPNVNMVPSRFWFPLGLPCLLVDPTAARKRGVLVLYSSDLFHTEARKPPSCPFVKPKMDLYCRGFSLSATSLR